MNLIVILSKAKDLAQCGWSRSFAALRMTGYIFLSFFIQSAFAAVPSPAVPQPSHGLSLWGTLKYPENFTHFDYVNPDAPRGGNVKLSATGSFDSLNPFIVKGNKAPGIGSVFESLMVGSLDEPQSFYGLIAQSVYFAPDRSFVEFTLRPEARFQDGTPITADDVVFSFDTLKKDGDPSYRVSYAPVSAAIKLDAHKVCFTFSDTSLREMPLLVAQMPIFSKAYYATHDFTQTTLEPPLGSGAYRVASVDAGRSIVYGRVKNYWGEHLPVNIGQNNFETMRYDMYRDEIISLEALKAHEYDFREENIARAWATGYDGEGLRSGRLKKELVPNQVPQGMQAFVFNVRRDKFADRRVREAIGLTLDFEWMNKTFFYGAYKRDDSYFLNTPYAASGLPDADERALLMPFKNQLPPELFTQAFALPKTDGSGNDRPQLLKADALLNAAGWVIKDGKRVNAKTGAPLVFEFLLNSPAFERAVAPMRRHLKQLGIDAGIRVIDSAQYIKRVEEFDYDIILMVFNKGVFFPGNEQTTYWQSSQAGLEGSNNVVGAKSPVLDALLARIADAHSESQLRPAARALDRVLLWEHYAIPNWYLGAWRVAYWDKFGRPNVIPKYSLGFQTWWVENSLKEKALQNNR